MFVCSNCSNSENLFLVIDEEKRIETTIVEEILLCPKCLEEMNNNVQDMYENNQDMYENNQEML